MKSLPVNHIMHSRYFMKILSIGILRIILCYGLHSLPHQPFPSSVQNTNLKKTSRFRVIRLSKVIILHPRLTLDIKTCLN